MARNLGKIAVGLPDRPAGLNRLGGDARFSADDCVCRMHARSPVVERVQHRAAIAVVVAGTFQARARAGETLLGPGAMLLKNPSSTQVYAHVDDGGDRSIVFEYDEDFLEDVRSSLGIHRRRWTFAQLAIPASADTAAAVVLALRAASSGDPDEVRAAAMEVAAIGIGCDGGSSQPTGPTPAQARRVARTLRYVDAHSTGDCGLATLATVAGLSDFHFIRVFRAVTGQTPHRYVIAARLRAAAAALHATRKPITEVALDAGFGDLSHFTTSFRRAFGVSPRGYRKQHRNGGGSRPAGAPGSG